jgi:hypothetical protein
VTENSPKPRKVRIKAGAPSGFFFPGKMPCVHLSDDEFRLVADALKLSPEDVARLPGFRAALDFELMHYVNARRAASTLPSQREVALALIKFAGHMNNAANDAVGALQMPRNSLMGATFTDEACARSEISAMTGADGKFLVNTAMDACSALNDAYSALKDAATNRASELDKTAGRPVKRERIDTLSFVVTLREILKSTGVSVSVGTDPDAGIAEDKYPMVRLARLMLKLALDRMDADHARETKAVFSQAPLTFVRFVREAKIT